MPEPGGKNLTYAWERHVQNPCRHCDNRALVIGYRPEWAPAPPDGRTAERIDRIARSCPRCDQALEGVRALTYTPGTAVSGNAPKVCATEVEHMKCRSCQHSAPVVWWPWMRCRSCGMQSRGRADTE